MKNLILALSLLFLVIVFIILNTLYLDYKTNELISLAAALPSPDNLGNGDQAITLLEEKWRDCYDLIALSVDFTYFYIISQQLSELRAFYEQNDESQYAAALYSLRVSFEHLREIEILSFKNIV